MRCGILKSNGCSLARGGAVLVVTSMAAGCSSGVTRLGVDDSFTTSTPNQQQIINQRQVQTYPGENQAALLVASNSDSVSRGSLQSSVSSQHLPAPTALAVRVQVEPNQIAQAENTTQVPGTNGNNLQPTSLPGTSNKVAVLSNTPKAKENSATAQLDVSASNNKAVPDTYKVTEGDTLNRIAGKLGVSTAALKYVNGLQDGRIRIDQTLKVPTDSATTTQVTKATTATVDQVTTSSAAPAKTTVAPANPVIDAPEIASYTLPKKDNLAVQTEALSEASPSSTGIDRMRWPVRGRIVQKYGNGDDKSSNGINILVPAGTPVKAAENGVVIYAGDGLKEFGNTVLVRHDNGLVTVYGHTSELKVQRGQKVKRGDEIALSGMSGLTDQPKLHFEVRKNSSPVDPSTYLE